MSSRLEWTTSTDAQFDILDPGTPGEDGQYTDKGNFGLEIKSPDGDGIVVEGSLGEILDFVNFMVTGLQNELYERGLV